MSTQDKTVRKLDSLYLGPKNDIDINHINSSLNNESIQYNVTPDQVADIIADKNAVALFQGDLRVDLEHLEIEVFYMIQEILTEKILSINLRRENGLDLLRAQFYMNTVMTGLICHL